MVRPTGPTKRVYSGPMAVAGGGADFLQLSPAAAPVRGLTAWLADAIRAAIMDGRLRAGAPLPASRLLAGDLGVSRGVIVEAYQRLADEGLVSARPGAGTRVLGVSRAAPGPVRADLPDPALRPLLVPAHWRERAEIDLSPGVPDLSGFPRAAWLRAERLVLEQASVADLGYGDPRGSQWLRTELADWLARTRGLRADPDDIIVVTGVAQALALLAQVLRSRSASTGCRSMTWCAATCGRCCSRRRTSSPPESCWPRGAAATCWTGPPGLMPWSSRTTTTRSTDTTGHRSPRCRLRRQASSLTRVARPRRWPPACAWAG